MAVEQAWISPNGGRYWLERSGWSYALYRVMKHRTIRTRIEVGTLEQITDRLIAEGWTQEA